MKITINDGILLLTLKLKLTNDPRICDKPVAILRSLELYASSRAGLIISRSLIELFNDAYLSSHLAFRGGTALHKLYLNPQVRYSEGLDLVQIYAEPIKETIEHIRDTLSFLGVPVIKQKANNNTLVFRMESEFAPVVPIRLKVEMNCREHFSVLGLTHSSFSVDNSWYSGSAQITIYKLDELLGTKLRALYQRKKGRDLFDLYHAITTADVNVDNIISCYRKYMEFVVGAVPGKRNTCEYGGKNAGPSISC